MRIKFQGCSDGVQQKILIAVALFFVVFSVSLYFRPDFNTIISRRPNSTMIFLNHLLTHFISSYIREKEIRSNFKPSHEPESHSLPLLLYITRALSALPSSIPFTPSLPASPVYPLSLSPADSPVSHLAQDNSHTLPSSSILSFQHLNNGRGIFWGDTADCVIAGIMVLFVGTHFVCVQFWGREAGWVVASRVVILYMHVRCAYAVVLCVETYEKEEKRRRIRTYQRIQHET